MHCLVMATFLLESTNILCALQKKAFICEKNDTSTAADKRSIFPIASFENFPYNGVITLERTMLWISISCFSCRSCGKVQPPG